MEGTVGKMNDHQPAAALQKLHEIRLCRVAQSGLFPIAVVQHDDVRFVHSGRSEKFDIRDRFDRQSRILAQRLFQCLGRLAPEMARVLMTGDNHRPNLFRPFAELRVDSAGRNVDVGGPGDSIEQQVRRKSSLRQLSK